MNTKIEDNIIGAIKIITDSAVSKASYDKTEKAQIVKCQNKATGQYLIKYKDLEQTAYAINPTIKYEKNQMVFITIPKNDSNAIKTILGPVDHIVTNTDEQKEIDQLYNTKGPNLLQGTLSYDFSSYENKSIKIYPSNEITLNNKIKQYIAQGNSLILKMNVQTILSPEQKMNGQYGVVYNMTFLDEGTEEEVQRSYKITQKDVIGNPYNLDRETFVSHLEIVDGKNFKRIDSIEVYCKNFPIQDQDGSKVGIEDIHISQISLQGAAVLSEQELSGYSVEIDYSTNGDSFNNQIKEILLKGIMKIKGVPFTDGVKYFWFRENGLVFQGQSGYSAYGGNGWECLNPYSKAYVGVKNNKIYFTSDENNEHYKNYKKGNSKIIAVLDQSKIIKVKCVAVYNTTITAVGYLTLYNDVVSNYSIQIISSDGDKRDYYYNNGSPNLTCLVKNKDGQELVFRNGEEDNREWRDNLTFDWNFVWSIENADGSIKQDSADGALSAFYDTERTYKNVKSTLKKVEKQSQQVYKNSDEYKNAVNNYKIAKKTEIIDKDSYFNVKIGNIKQYSKFICGVGRRAKGSSDNYTYIGTASITLYNHMTSSGQYSVNIINGSQVFQYDDDGRSPCLKSRQRPFEILPLGFTLSDNEGVPISYNKVIKNGTIYWCIPKTNTLLIPPDGDYSTALPYQGLLGTVRTLAADNTYAIYENLQSFSYSIADTFDSKKTENNIRLYIIYKDIIFDSYTNFVFPKSGDPGTNGTPYYAKIWPVNEKAEIITTDRVYIKTTGSIQNVSSKYDFYADGGQKVSNLEFRLYNNASNDIPEVNTPSQWICPIQKNQKGESYFKWNNGIKISQSDLSKITRPINILRARYGTGSDTKYYAELPLNFVNITSTSNNYRIKIREKTGFSYVVYDNDGTHPQYDSSKPFEIIIQEEQNGYYIEQNPDSYTFTWEGFGCLSVDSNNKTNINEVIPSSHFDGTALFNAIKVTVRRVGFIYIPIYFLINRYGFKALNDWDGNSIELKQNEGVILSPQVGAGKKNADNTFSGVLMGSMQVGNTENTGLLGFDHGERTILLDSDTGKAEFGKNNAGKIAIDPSLKVGKDTSLTRSTRNNFKDAGLLYSGNYTLPTSTVENGISYLTLDVSKHKPGNGMVIDLSTPQIGFGSGNFYVTDEGNLHSETGDIGGWQITANTLQSTNGAGGVYLNSDNSKLSNKAIQVHDNSKDRDIFSVDYEGNLHSQAGDIGGWDITTAWLHKGRVGMNSISSIEESPATVAVDGTTKSKAFFANGNNFYVTHDGYLKSQSGKIANWNISADMLTDNHTGLGSTVAPLNAFGKNTSATLHLWSGDSDGLNFAVTNEGRLYAKYGSVGGWNMSTAGLSSGTAGSTSGGILLDPEGTIQGGTNEYTWTINNEGKAAFNNIEATGGKIGNWNISSGAIVGQDNKVSLKKDGTIVANAGSIGGVTISNDGLRTNNWYILSNGKASFTDVIGLSGSLGTGTLTGGSYSGGGYSGCTISPYDNYATTGQTLDGYMTAKVSASTGQFGQLIIDNELSYGNKTVKMESLYVGLSVRTEDFYAYETASATTKRKYTLTTPVALLLSVGQPPTGCEYYCGIGYVLHGTSGFQG